MPIPGHQAVTILLKSMSWYFHAFRAAAVKRQRYPIHGDLRQRKSAAVPHTIQSSIKTTVREHFTGQQQQGCSHLFESWTETPWLLVRRFLLAAVMLAVVPPVELVEPPIAPVAGPPCSLVVQQS